MRITTQSIPSQLSLLYSTAFASTLSWKGADIARLRQPFKIPSLQGGIDIDGNTESGSGVSPAQIAQRQIFVNSVKCFRKQPRSGGAVPPDIGPRNRSWWYNESLTSGLFYYNYFMQQTMNSIISGTIPDWCKIMLVDIASVVNIFPTYTNPGEYEFLIHKSGSITAYAFIKNPTSQPATLFMKIKGVIPTSPPPLEALIQVFSTSDDWRSDELTWNNMPPLQSLLYSGVFTCAVGDWIGISLPYAPSYALSLVNPFDTENTILKEVKFYGYIVGVPTYRPYAI